MPTPFHPTNAIARIVTKQRQRLNPPAIEGIALASPLRRWAAAATDALLLFVAHLLILAPFTFFAPDQLAVLRGAVIVSPCAGWAYLWWGWARGQTIGQRAWKMRVIADNGEAMTAGRALKRLFGYALVCLTLKIGLLPILWDPLRRGWHDRIAGTLVVDERASAPESATLREAFVRVAAREHLATTRRALPPMPDFALARRGWPFVFAAYLALSVALTWPVALLWRTTIVGGGDAWVFVWNNWFFARAVASGGPFLSTDLLFYPFQTPLLFHTMNWFDCVLAWPLLRFFSPVETYNLLFLLTPALCALAAYWLACSLSKSRLASFVVAPVFGFSPYFMAHGLGHANLTSAQMLPIFAGLFYAALVSGRARYACGAGVALALAGLCDWQYLLFGSVSAVALWAGVEWSLRRAGQRFQLRRAGLGIGALLGAGLLLSPMLVPLAREGKNASYMNKSGQAGGFSAGLSDWTRAGKLHPIFHPARDSGGSNENNLTPGWCVLALCALALALATRHTALARPNDSVRSNALRRSNALVPWLCVGALSWVLACGPSLSVRWSELWLIIGLGAPGNGFNPPWNTAQLVVQSQQVALGMPVFSTGGLIEMPFRWLAPHLPMLQAFRVPARLGVVVLMCCAPVAAIGLQWLLARANDKRAWLRPLVVVGVAAVIGFEYLTYPFPTSDISVPAFYRQIARDPARYAVVDVPISTNSRSMGWQTVHGKPMLVGVLARAPARDFDLVARNDLLRALSAEVFDAPNAPNAMSAGSDFDYAPALRELQNLNVRYLVVHKDRIADTNGARMTALLQQLQLPVVFEDAQTRVYRVESPQKAAR